MPTPNLSPAVQHVDIDLGDRSYRIDIGAALLDHALSFAGLPAASSALIVSNTTVAPLYLERLQRCCRAPIRRSTRWPCQTVRLTKPGNR
jgi:3-dehydroquinate synthase